MELAEQKRVLPLGERKIERMGGKIGENKGSSKPNKLRALEKRPKALSCKCSHVSLAVHYVCSSEQCDGARKTATPAWISLEIVKGRQRHEGQQQPQQKARS